MKAKNLWSALLGGLIGLLIVSLTALPAHAIDVSTPITGEDGIIGCATCATESTPAQYNIPVWGTTQEFGTIAPSSQTTYFLRSKGTSANPAFEALAIGDIPSGTATQWGALIGTPTGSGEFVRATNPSLAGVTITGAVSASGATAPFTLPAGAIGSTADLASGIKTGSGTKLATFTGSVPGANRCIRMTSGGDLEATASDCSSGSGVNALVAPKSQTKVSSGATTVYMDAVGALGTTDDLGTQTVVPAGTWGNLRCSASSNGTGASVTVAKGTCGSALSTTSMPTVALSTANAVTKDTSTTFTTAADQCINFKIVKTSFAATAWVTCVLERTANS